MSLPVDLAVALPAFLDRRGGVAVHVEHEIPAGPRAGDLGLSEECIEAASASMPTQDLSGQGPGGCDEIVRPATPVAGEVAPIPQEPISNGRRGQNTSHAVMAQRVEPHDSLDFFPTPPWATRALVEHVIVGHGWRFDNLIEQSCWEPACGQGHMVGPLQEYFRTVRASDVHDYGQKEKRDFLFGPNTITDWIITNPPFRLALEFALTAKSLARQGVAMLVRTSFLESAERFRGLFRPHPPLIVAPFVERVPMLKGRLDRKASSATSYAWIVWPGFQHIRTADARIVWIPPCRAQLERDADYQAIEGAP